MYLCACFYLYACMYVHNMFAGTLRLEEEVKSPGTGQLGTTM